MRRKIFDAEVGNKSVEWVTLREPTLRSLVYFFTSGHSLSLSGLAASSGEMVATSL